MEKCLADLFNAANTARDNNNPGLANQLYKIHDMVHDMVNENEMLAPHLESIMDNKSVNETVKLNIAIWLGLLN
jgi:hypothetical protein